MRAFSFNSDKGRYPHCKGAGFIDLQILFLKKIDLPCEECDGTGYKPEILDVKYKGSNIHDILNLTVSESIETFQSEERISNQLRFLDEILEGNLLEGDRPRLVSLTIDLRHNPLNIRPIGPREPLAQRPPDPHKLKEIYCTPRGA